MTIEYVNPQTGAAHVDGNNDPSPRLTRHVYHGLEVVQEYTCTGDAGGTGPWTYHYLRDVHAAGHSNVQTAQKSHAASTEDQLEKVQEASRRSLLVAEPEQTSAKLPQSAKSA